MKPANNFAKELIASLDDAGIKWRDYSGRGMYGDSCVGVTCGRDHSEGEVYQAVGVNGSSAHRDSMGLGTILYWPKAKLVDDDAMAR
jgi:hypothetical protein